LLDAPSGQPELEAVERGGDMSTPEAERREQSIAEHVRGLSEESAGMVREQAQLIRDDLIDELKRLGMGGVMLGGAGLLGLGAFGAFTTGLVSAFGGGTRGALTVTVVYGAGAGGLAVAGREQLRKTAARAADTLGRDVQAAAEGVRQGG
jgi:Putative Actinobacterial Holin-X, holin superfamily III